MHSGRSLFCYKHMDFHGKRYSGYRANTKGIQMKMKRIIALAAFSAIGVQAGNIATDGVIGNMTVGAGDLGPVFPGTGLETNVIDSAAGDQRFYRLRVELP